MKASKKQLRTVGRLKRRSDFLRVQAAGKKWVSTGMVVQVAENGTPASRYGLTVSKKTDKSAVARNRIKRRLRALVVDILPARGKAGFDYVLIGRTQTATRPFCELERDLVWCLKRLDLLAKEQSE